MSYAAKPTSTWVLLPYGEPVTLNDTQVSYETLNLWSEEERNKFGIWSIPEPNTPLNKVETSRELNPSAPEWQVTYTDLAPVTPSVPDGPTLSDWRVGLMLWGRLDEVKNKVTLQANLGNPLGKMAQERLEYANHVLKEQLYQIKSVFGFTEAEVDESLWRAYYVSQGDISGNYPVN